MKAILAFFLLLLLVCNARAQYTFDYYYDCAMTSGSSYSALGGNYKPERTDMSGGQPLTDTTVVFPVLIVFVQFKDDPFNDVWWWERGEAPLYMDSLISPVRRNNSSQWWDAYNQNEKEAISDYWHEISRGHLHIAGQVFNIILDSNQSYYNSNGGYQRINQEIWEKLKALQTINWQDYDRWRRDGSGVFHYETDGYIDMIYKIHRTNTQNSNFPELAFGYAYLGGSAGDTLGLGHPVGSGIYINGGFGAAGSGLTLAGKFGVPTKTSVIGGVGHEVGHYLFSGGGINYAKMTHYRPGDFFYSPWESIKMGYIGPRVVNFVTQTDFDLDDYSSRHNDSIAEVLQVPISGTDEFFLLANRRKVSDYDRVMDGGDTSHDNAMRQINPEYGKGLYIYHITGGYTYSNNKDMDQECADGLFNWTQDGYAAPDWNPTSATLPYVKWVSVSYNNDNGKLADAYNTTAYNKDGKDIGGRTTTNGLEHKWFSEGEKQASQGGDGIDRLFTNTKEPWTSREAFGDRWDAWDVGYNEVFSPYSSPNTHKWNNDTSQIFIWFYDLHHENVGSIKIYRVGHGSGYTEDDILEITPPSRPMGIKEEECVFVNGQFRPKISWNHNMEPDMERVNQSEQYFKRYKVYRSVSTDMNTVPPDAFRYPEQVYTYVTTVDILSNTPPSYVDTALISGCYIPDGQCPPNCWIEYPIRYRVQAIDKYDDESVLSDFAATTGIRTESGDPGGEEEDNPGITQSNTDIPTVFDLKQNYPNPFNPTTNIQFDLPKDVFVSVKVYDMLGREVAVLVNELRQAGSYIVAFNGSTLASGIYYYKIKAGTFEATKRMVLIK